LCGESQQKCEENPEETALINVHNTLTAARFFAKQGTHLIFLSSDKVFDGKQARVPVDSLYSPLCEYGRQKMEAEIGFRDLGGGVLRLSKVLGASVPLFDSWATAWRKGLPIEAFSDLYFAPVPLDRVVLSLSRLIEDKAQDVYQLSAEKDISYYEAAKIGAAALKIPEERVGEASIPPSLKTFLRPRAWTSLDTSRIRSRYGLNIPSAYDSIEAVFRGIEL
jgi:dTDP-4-dehydrorhamnose reductase